MPSLSHSHSLFHSFVVGSRKKKLEISVSISIHRNTHKKCTKKLEQPEKKKKKKKRRSNIKRKKKCNNNSVIHLRAYVQNDRIRYV